MIYHAYCIILIYDTVKHSGKRTMFFDMAKNMPLKKHQAWDRLWLVYYCLFRIALWDFPFFPHHLHRSCRTNSLPWQNVSMQELGAQRSTKFVVVSASRRVPGEKITVKFIQVTMLQRQCETDRPGSPSIFGGVSVESWVKDLGEIPWNTPEWTMWEWW